MRTRNMLRGVCAGAAAALVFSVAAVPGFPGAESPEQIQKKRTLTMKAINKALLRIRVYAGKGQLKELSAAALEVSNLVARIPELSPEGSAFGDKSRIKPEVWTNFAHFKELSEKTAAAARALAKTARIGDTGSLMRSFVDLAKACGACHKFYRKKKKRRGL